MLSKVIHILLVLAVSFGVPSMAQTSDSHGSYPKHNPMPNPAYNPALSGPPAETVLHADLTPSLHDTPPAGEAMPSGDAASDSIPSSIASTEVAQNPSEPESDLSYEELRRFARAFSVIKNQYVEPVSEKELIEAAIQGMLQDLDPHSVFLNKEGMADLQEETEGEFGGLGIEIGEDSGYVKVIAPIEGTPAARAGILAGDLILKIDGANMKDKPINEVVKLLRGNAGSEVVLTVKRSTSDAALDVSITRELIKIQSVRSKMIGDTAYFRISQFQTNTVGDLAVQIRRISERHTPRSIILDLRNDPGGLLNVAVGVVQAFHHTNQVVVSTKARDQLVEEFSDYVVENLSYGTNPLRNLPKWTNEAPMVVLINVGSASASEIVAGALQDFKRATVMGNRSFGKGSVQVVMALDEETGIKLTTARYYTPLGRSIQATGITPDIVVSDTEKGDLFSFSREVDLRDHLENETEKAPEVKRSDEALRPGPEDVFEFGSEQDFQLRQALNHLQGLPVNQGVISQDTSAVGEATEQVGAQNAESPVSAAAEPSTTTEDSTSSSATPTSVEPSSVSPSLEAAPAGEKPASSTPGVSEKPELKPSEASEKAEPSTPASGEKPESSTPPASNKPAPMLDSRPNRHS